MRTPPESAPIAMWAYEELREQAILIQRLQERISELEELLKNKLDNSST